MRRHQKELNTFAPVLTVAEAALLLKVNVKTVYQYINNGLIPAVKLGPHCTRIGRDALMDWINSGGLSTTKQ